MFIVCLDLEGVLVPEIWINVAEKTGVKELRLTTRDEPDYDILMKKRLAILDDNKLKIQDIQEVIAAINPLDGAREFLDWLRLRSQVIIVSDTFIQFSGSLMEKLGHPTIFCNSLLIAPDGAITGYKMRQQDGKKKTALALKNLNYQIIAIGDSYNDISMLKEADTGILFNPPDSIKNEFSEFVASYTYDDLKEILLNEKIF